MNKIHFYIILLLIQSNTIIGQKKPQSSVLYSKIDAYLTAGSKNGFSGAIAVLKNGEPIINKGYGFANKDTKTLNNPNTIFDIGSNTKQFTSTAILKLVELEKLNLNDPISSFFENLPAEKRNITIHQLLTHTAGFSESIGKDFDKISQQDFFKALFSSELLYDPGERYSYSNTGYSILGRIIELVSGQAYEFFLNEHLFEPAGMKQTGYLLPEWDNNQLSRGYNRNVLESDPAITRYRQDIGITWHLNANGGINSTQNDMLLWHKALKTNIILSAESFKTLITPHVLSPKGTYSYGYGWVVKNSEANTPRISHNGSNGIFYHTLIWYPEEDIYIVYATNANSLKVESIAYVVEKMILDENYIPKPIENNVYAFSMDFIKQHATTESDTLIEFLQKNYADEYANSGLLNTIGNLLIMLEQNKDWALELFKLNIQRYPEDGNLWDSLGDGYKANHLKEDAIKSYQKAIELGYKDAQEKLDELVKTQ